jgi:V8-like Glu-specific endopeptidase
VEEETMRRKENEVLKLSTTLIAILVAFAVAVLGSSLAGAQIEPPPGPAPSVDATEVEEAEPFLPSFQEGEDEPAPAPNHPPINEIPPMPMPEDTDEVPASMEPLEGGTFYDAITGETVTASVDELALFGGSGWGGGYSGADGGEQDPEGLLASFGTMSMIGNTEDHPWRMNAKVVIRFGGSFFVCSGTMRDPETVFTAGHCVYDYGGAGWADEIWVYPGWDGVGGQATPPWQCTDLCRCVRVQ